MALKCQLKAGRHVLGTEEAKAGGSSVGIYSEILCFPKSGSGVQLGVLFVAIVADKWVWTN